MNLRRVSLLLAIRLGGAVSAWAQAPSTTGTVIVLSREAGWVTIMPDGSQRPAYFRGMQRARYVFGNGQRASFDNLDEGQVVTVQYTRVGSRWYVAQVVLPDRSETRYPGMPPGGLSFGERQAGRALTDRDITTQPGSKARIDRDITTQPGSTDPRTNTDITKRPGSTDPRTNTDITKRPDNR